MTVTSGNGKFDLHKQNVSVCFFSEQKCNLYKTLNIIKMNKLKYVLYDTRLFSVYDFL
jgi:hypothetical protein